VTRGGNRERYLAEWRQTLVDEALQMIIRVSARLS